MNEKERMKGFEALLNSDKSNSYHLEEPDGEHRLWKEASAQSRLENIAGAAAMYDVPFEQFAHAVRESIENADIVDGALRIVLDNAHELRGLASLLPEEGTFSTPLIDRFRYILDAQPEANFSGQEFQRSERPALKPGDPAWKELTEVIKDIVSERYVENPDAICSPFCMASTGDEPGFEFAALNRQDRLDLLLDIVPWRDYEGLGITHAQWLAVIENVRDGKPQDRWLEGVFEKAQKPTLQDILDGKVSVEGNTQGNQLDRGIER